MINLKQKKSNKISIFQEQHGPDKAILNVSAQRAYQFICLRRHTNSSATCL